MGWFAGWMILAIGLGALDLPAWYRVVGLVGGFLVTILGIISDAAVRKMEIDKQ